MFVYQVFVRIRKVIHYFEASVCKQSIHQVFRVRIIWPDPDQRLLTGSKKIMINWHKKQPKIESYFFPKGN